MNNLSLNDGQATPVARTFEIVRPWGGAKLPAQWVYRPAAATDRTLDVLVSVGFRRNGTKSHHALHVQVPYTYTVNSVVTRGLGLYDSSSGGFMIPDDMPAASVADLLAFKRNFEAHNDIKTVLAAGRPIV